MTDIVKSIAVALEAGKCTDNMGCNVCSTCMCSLVEDALDALKEQRAEIKRLRAETKWHPIDTAPQDGTYILGFHRESAKAHGHGDAGLCVLCWVDADEDGRWEAQWQIKPFLEGLDCVVSDEMPTHWRPLPTPPEGGTDE